MFDESKIGEFLDDMLEKTRAAVDVLGIKTSLEKVTPSLIISMGEACNFKSFDGRVRSIKTVCEPHDHKTAWIEVEFVDTKVSLVEKICEVWDAQPEIAENKNIAKMQGVELFKEITGDDSRCVMCVGGRSMEKKDD